MNASAPFAAAVGDSLPGCLQGGHTALLLLGESVRAQAKDSPQDDPKPRCCFCAVLCHALSSGCMPHVQVAFPRGHSYRYELITACQSLRDTQYNILGSRPLTVRYIAIKIIDKTALYRLLCHKVIDC